MKDNYEEVKKAVYTGMATFNLIKDYDLKLYNKNLNLEDKKYLSLYLGIINTNNNFSLFLKENEIRFGINFKCSYKLLSTEDFLNLYNDYFVDVIKEINFNSIEENVNYLLSKKIIQDFNKCNGHNLNKIINDKNKQLIK